MRNRMAWHCHAARTVSTGQFEHAQVEGMEACKRDELVLIAHRPQLHLEPRELALETAKKK